MARVTYGSGVTELAGSIGGVTYQKNASGNIAKLRANPTVNPTLLQSTYQRNLAQCVSHWPTLTQAQKDGWDTLAAAHDHTTVWGETKTLSGYQWFLSVNLIRVGWGRAILDSAPTWSAEVPPDAFTIETSATYIRAAWSPDYDPVHYNVFYMSLPLRQSSLKLRRSLFVVAMRQLTTPMTNYDLTSEFEALAGVTWSTFYATADCSIIIRIAECWIGRGLMSSFTSAIVKI